MFFKRRHEAGSATTEEELEILSNRLEGSIYYEDKVGALNTLLKMSEIQPVATGTYALYNIIHSMKAMEDVSVQLSILRNILLCSHRLEFIDMIIKDLDCLEVLCDCIKSKKNGGDVHDLLCTLNTSELFPSQVLRIPDMAYYCVQMVRERKTGLVLSLIERDLDFKKQIVFEGIFEAALDVLGENYSRDVIHVVSRLLRDCPFNQNYFSELDWKIVTRYLSLHPEEVFDVLTALVDLKNIDVDRLQSSVHKAVGLPSMFKYRQWNLIYLVIKDNVLLTEKFIEDVLDLDEIARRHSTDTHRKQNEACVLINYLLFHRSLKIPDTGSYKVYGIQSLREQELPIDKFMRGAFEKIRRFGDMKLSTTFDMLVFIIFNFDAVLVEEMVPTFIDIFSDYTRPEAHRNLCLIALLMLEIPIERININSCGVVCSLKAMRRLLCNVNLSSEFYLIDTMAEMLLDNISDLVGRYSQDN